MNNNFSYLFAQAAPLDEGQGVTSTTVASPSTAPEGKAKPEGFMFQNYFFIVLLLLVFYFMLLRPQQRREKERNKMLNALQKGDKVVTRGGLVGLVMNLKEDEGIAVVKIAENTKVETLISAIEAVNPKLEDLVKPNAKKKKKE